MCDGELILENSPLHQYLQEIGWDDTQTITRAAAPQIEPKSTAHAEIDYLQNLLSNVRSLVKTITCHFHDSALHLRRELNAHPQLNLSELRNQAEPHLLSHHKESLEDLLTSGTIRNPPSKCPSRIPVIVSPMILYSVVFIALLFMGIFTNFSDVLVNTIIFIASFFIIYLYWTNHQRNKNSFSDTVSIYVDSIRTFKQLSKVMLSHLRDCQIARTPYATGVTWSMLDNIEKQCSGGLQSAEMRAKLFGSVRAVFLEHKRTVEGWLESGPLVSEIDCVNRYICLQGDLEILSESETMNSDIHLSSHTLRYNLKLVEHVSSEVLWRLIVSTYPLAWPGAQLSNRKIQNMLATLSSLQKMVSERESELRRYYEKHNNPEIESAVLAPTTNDDSSTSRALHQLQLLHSSLNIATIRCRDVHTLLSQDKASDLSSSLSLIKLNIDLADATLQTLANLTETSPTLPTPLQPAGPDQTLEEGEGKEAVPIVPYQQQGNMVFSGVNDGAGSDGGVGDLDSDDELELNLHRHKQESKLMLEELRHVIETNPTCLYEDDYEEFKRTGLLNPTKQELKELYENKSEDESDTEQTETSDRAPQRIGFNPLSLPFPSHPFSSGSFPPTLFNEMEICEAYGDLSEEEEDEVGELGEETECLGASDKENGEVAVVGRGNESNEEEEIRKLEQ